MADPQIPIPDGSLRVETIGQLQDWNEDKIRRHFRGQVDSMIADLIEKLKAGVFGRLSDIFRGVSPPGMGDFFDQVWAGLSGNLSDALSDAPGLESRLTPIRDAARGLIAPVADRVDAVEESQLSAEEQLAALDGVRGYGGVYMSRNVNASGLGGNERWLPFDAPVGVMKGVHVGVSADDARQVGLVLESPGVWQINFRVHARSTSATPGIGVPDNSQAYPGVYRIGADGVWRMWRESILVVNNGRQEATITGSMLVSIPDDGFSYAVGAYAWSARWRWWSGGMKYSDLSVVKHDNRPGVVGEMTVPDE